MTVSASFVPLHPGSWLMSILDAFGAVPSNFTVPLIVATVAGSIGVAGCAAGCSAAGLAAGASSFLLHAASTSSAHSAKTPTIHVAQRLFLFIMSPFLKVRPQLISCHSERAGANATATRGICFSAGNSTANLRPLHGATPPPPAPAASTTPPAAAPLASTGRCNPRGACDDRPQNR